MTQPILHQLKAEALLADTGILEKVDQLRRSFTYKSDRDVYSFDDYYNVLLKQSEGIEQIQLLTAVPPGTAQKYLVDLTQALQNVTDKIESVHSRALFFAGKVRAAIHNRNTLKAAFSVWYQVALADVLTGTKLKFTASVQAALAESEFTRLLGDDVALEGMEDAVDMLIDHLKGAKKLATEKYKIGTEQANASIIKAPNVGLSEGESFPLLRQRYNLQEDPKTAKPHYDDEEEETDALEAVSGDPQYVQRREHPAQEISDSTVKMLHASVEKPEVAVVSAEDLPKAVKAWHDENFEAEYEGYTVPLPTGCHKGASPWLAEAAETAATIPEPEDEPPAPTAPTPEIPYVEDPYNPDPYAKAVCSLCGLSHPADHTCTPATDANLKKAKPKPEYDDEDQEFPDAKPTKVMVIEDDFIGTVKVTKPADGPATITKEKGGKFADFEDDAVSAPKPKTKPKYDDDEEDESPAPPASTPEPVTPKPIKKDRKRISFDDPF